MELSYQTLKLTHQAREAVRRATPNKRNPAWSQELLLQQADSRVSSCYGDKGGCSSGASAVALGPLVKEASYIDAANALEEETKLGLRRFEVCDNVDLETILMEYESYYFVKFQKYPKMVKKAPDPVFLFLQESENNTPIDSADFGLNISKIHKDSTEKPHPRRGQIIDFRGLLTDAIKGTTSELTLNTFECNPDPSERLLKPLSAFIGMNSEMRELAAVVSRVIFELARYHAPYTILLYELESVMSQRGMAPGGEHEGSLRMKTELLVQMDGLARSEDLVFVLAASNLPWDLDCAMLRRLEKRILVDLPSQEAREAMIYHWLPPVSKNQALELHTELEYSFLSQETEGYSGSDIKLVCREAAMRPVRKIFSLLENHQPEGSSLPEIHLDTVTTKDFLEVLAHSKPSAKNLTQRYLAWQDKFESV
ncbi:katanin p60 subunit A-like 2 [Cricetulus griseus]